MVDQFIKFPFAVTVSSLGVVTDAIRAMTSGMDVANAPGGQRAFPQQSIFPTPPTPGSAPFPPPGADGAGGLPFPREEENTVRDSNLNDDMVRLVKYRIVFTKPDHEDVLSSKEETINYRTSVEQYAGLQMARLMVEVYADPNHKYRFLLEKANQRYVKVSVEVLDRFPKEDEYFERRQTEAWERISRAVGGPGGLEK